MSHLDNRTDHWWGCDAAANDEKTNMLFHLIFSPKIDWHWSGGFVQWQQVQQGHPGVSFPGNVLQVPPWDPEHSLLLGLPVPVGHAWLSSRTQMLRTTNICSFSCEWAAPPLQAPDPNSNEDLWYLTGWTHFRCFHPQSHQSLTRAHDREWRLKTIYI